MYVMRVCVVMMQKAPRLPPPHCSQGQARDYQGESISHMTRSYDFIPSFNTQQHVDRNVTGGENSVEPPSVPMPTTQARTAGATRNQVVVLRDDVSLESHNCHMPVTCLSHARSCLCIAVL